MADIRKGVERRRYPRVGLTKAVRAKTREDIVDGAIGDVSVGAVKVRSDAGLAIGQEVELEIEGLSTVSGRVSRTLDDGFVVSLGLKRDEEDRLIAEIMQIQNDLHPEGGEA